MFTKLKTYINEGFTYSGLEITQSEQGETYFLLEIKKTNKELLITHKKELNGLGEVTKALNKQHPIFVCVNTSNVLTKKVDNVNTTNCEALVNQAFPNLDLDNFYYEVIQQTGNAIVTISKKESIDGLIKRLQESKIKISKFSLGISSIENVLQYVEDESIVVSNYRISIIDNAIENVLPDTSDIEQKYMINGLELYGNHLLSFALILGHLGKNKTNTNFDEVSERLSWGFKNNRIFNQILKISLAFFIVLLLGNFVIYNSYHEEVGTLNAAITATSSQKDELTLLDASVHRKQERVETLSASANSKATYYLDLFAQNIPNSILLDEIKYQPLAKPLREKKPVLLEEKVLLISGISKDVNEFSLWIEALEKQEWVNSVETLDYDYISKSTSSFLIEIEFNEMSHED